MSEERKESEVLHSEDLSLIIIWHVTALPYLTVWMNMDNTTTKAIWNVSIINFSDADLLFVVWHFMFHKFHLVGCCDDSSQKKLEAFQLLGSLEY